LETKLGLGRNKGSKFNNSNPKSSTKIISKKKFCSIDEIDVNDENKHVAKPFTDSELQKMSSDISTYQSLLSLLPGLPTVKLILQFSQVKKREMTNLKPIQEFKKKIKVDELRSKVQTIVNMFIFICYLLGETLYWIVYHLLQPTVSLKLRNHQNLSLTDFILVIFTGTMDFLSF